MCPADCLTLMAEPTFRKGTAEDALHLAALLDIASRGLANWFWSTKAESGQSPIEVGRRRVLEETALPSHYRNWIVGTTKGQAIGGFAGYVASDHTPCAEHLPTPYAPILELEAGAVGTWYMMALAVFPEYRNRGLGSAMLEKA